MRTPLVCCLLCVCLMTGSGQSSAQQRLAQTQELTGLLLDQTFSTLGSRFFDGFSRAWRSVPVAQSTNLVVNEGRAGTTVNRISIFYEHQLVFVFNLSIRQTLDSNVFERASAQVANQIQSINSQNASHGPIVGDLYYTEW